MKILLAKPETKQGIIAQTIGILVFFTIIMAVVLAIILAMIGLGPVYSLKDSFTLDSSTKATILTKEKGNLNKTCHVTYQFEVDGVQYTGPIYDDVSISTFCFRKLSNKVEIIYDSANPAHNTLALHEILIGSKFFFYLITIAWIPLWIIGIIARIYRTRRWLASLDTNSE